MPDELFPIMVVEDSDDDLFLFRRLLGKAQVRNPLSIATNGQAAIDDLSAAVAKGTAVPRILFLDLKLPLRSGFEVLEWVRKQPQLQGTVVLILSSSAEGRDVKRAYELGAHGYLVKYPTPNIFGDVVRLVGQQPPGPITGLEFPGIVKP